MTAPVFQDSVFYIKRKTRNWADYVSEVTSNGGTIAPTEDNADFCIAEESDDPATVYPPNPLRPEFIADCIAAGRIVGVDGYQITPPALLAKRRQSRTPFTAADDRVLLEWVESAQRRGETIGGNLIYKELEKKHPNHTWQSWRTRYHKYIENKRPVTAAELPKPVGPGPSWKPQRAKRAVESENGGLEKPNEEKESPKGGEPSIADTPSKRGERVIPVEDGDDRETAAEDPAEFLVEKPGETPAKKVVETENQTDSDPETQEEQTGGKTTQPETESKSAKHPVSPPNIETNSDDEPVEETTETDKMGADESKLSIDTLDDPDGLPDVFMAQEFNHLLKHYPEIKSYPLEIYESGWQELAKESSFATADQWREFFEDVVGEVHRQFEERPEIKDLYPKCWDRWMGENRQNSRKPASKWLLAFTEMCGQMRKSRVELEPEEDDVSPEQEAVQILKQLTPGKLTSKRTTPKRPAQKSATGKVSTPNKKQTPIKTPPRSNIPPHSTPRTGKKRSRDDYDDKSFTTPTPASKHARVEKMSARAHPPQTPKQNILTRPEDEMDEAVLLTPALRNAEGVNYETTTTQVSAGDVLIHPNLSPLLPAAVSEPTQLDRSRPISSRASGRTQSLSPKKGGTPSTPKRAQRKTDDAPPGSDKVTPVRNGQVLAPTPKSRQKSSQPRSTPRTRPRTVTRAIEDLLANEIDGLSEDETDEPAIIRSQALKEGHKSTLVEDSQVQIHPSLSQGNVLEGAQKPVVNTPRARPVHHVTFQPSSPARATPPANSSPSSISSSPLFEPTLSSPKRTPTPRERRSARKAPQPKEADTRERSSPVRSRNGSSSPRKKAQASALPPVTPPQFHLPAKGRARTSSTKKSGRSSEKSTPGAGKRSSYRGDSLELSLTASQPATATVDDRFTTSIGGKVQVLATPQPQDTHRLLSRVDDLIKAYGCTQIQAFISVYATSGNFLLDEEVVRSLIESGDVPADVPHIWTPIDDESIKEVMGYATQRLNMSEDALANILWDQNDEGTFLYKLPPVLQKVRVHLARKHGVRGPGGCEGRIEFLKHCGM